MDFREMYANKLRSLIKNAGMPIPELAKQAKLDYTHLYNVSIGLEAPKMKDLEQVCWALDVDIDTEENFFESENQEEYEQDDDCKQEQENPNVDTAMPLYKKMVSFVKRIMPL